MDLQNNAWFSSYFCLFGMPLQPFQKKCVEKLVHIECCYSILSIVRSALAIERYTSK